MNRHRIFQRIRGAGLMHSSRVAKERSPPAATWAAACSRRGQRGAGGRQWGGKVCLAREQEVAVSREPFAELSS